GFDRRLLGRGDRVRARLAARAGGLPGELQRVLGAAGVPARLAG
ncbi:MAG: hypothetical protein AVDCRST_MAG75-655, partial [uncultured Propionibacteriaceae bacterium]